MTSRTGRLFFVFVCVFVCTGCSKRSLEDVLNRRVLGPPPCTSTFTFAPPLGPTKYSEHQIDYDIERQRCDASNRTPNAAVEKRVEVTHLSSVTKAPGEGGSEFRVELLWKQNGAWTRVVLDSGDYPGETSYASSTLPDEFANRHFEVAEDASRVAVIELPSKMKPALDRAWIVDRAAGKPRVTEVKDAPTAAALLARK